MLHIRGPKGIVLGAIVFGSIFFLIGTIMLVMSVNGYRDGEATESWPSTTARILSSSVHENVDRTRDANGRMQTKTHYESVVQYEYELDGRTYQGYRIKAGDYGGTADRAYEIVNRYPVGAQVPAYYDPDEASQAVLEQGADRTTVYLFAGMGVLFSIIGLGAVAYAGGFARRTARRPSTLARGMTTVP